ncbi:hypothetical protein Acr_00g0075940 [Actinidia rufa]|uniref:Uncharacterized protein n=1 Tax=Actinidia rufa TaxID=165716 RepID=A0A7J0DSX9_9ERIC|nr:hypothetical protein Acr_00g0075940 [Actinidia rufa]
MEVESRREFPYIGRIRMETGLGHLILTLKGKMETREVKPGEIRRVHEEHWRYQLGVGDVVISEISDLILVVILSIGGPHTRSAEVEHLYLSGSDCQMLMWTCDDNVVRRTDLTAGMAVFYLGTRNVVRSWLMVRIDLHPWIQLRIPGEDGMILSTRPGEVSLLSQLVARLGVVLLQGKARQEPAQRITEQRERVEEEVLASKTFQKYFDHDRMEISSNGGENTTSGDEGEFCLSQDDLQCGSPFRNNSVKYLRVIWGDIGRITRRAFPDIPDLTLLRWLRGKDQDPLSNFFLNGPSSSSDSKLETLLDSVLSPELKFDAMSSWINLSTLTKKLVPGGPSTSPGDNLGPGALMYSALMARKILNGVILPADKGKAMKTDAELKDKSEAMAQLKAELLHHHPKLGVDLASMVMDTDLAEEEKAAKTGEKEEDNEGEANLTP